MPALSCCQACRDPPCLRVAVLSSESIENLGHWVWRHVGSTIVADERAEPLPAALQGQVMGERAGTAIRVGAAIDQPLRENVVDRGRRGPGRLGFSERLAVRCKGRCLSVVDRQGFSGRLATADPSELPSDALDVPAVGDRQRKSRGSFGGQVVGVAGACFGILRMRARYARRSATADLLEGFAGKKLPPARGRRRGLRGGRVLV
jgi:hypothetical protein